MVVLEHVDQTFPEQGEIVFGEAGSFLCEICRYIALNTVQAVGDNLFLAHCLAFLGILRICHGLPCNCYFLLEDGILASGKI